MASSSEENNQKIRKPIGEALQEKRGRRFLGLSLSDFVRYFFSGNATVAIVVVVLIMVFLFREGAGFVPMYQDSLALYRKAGLEFADSIRSQVDRHKELSRELNRLRLDALDHYKNQGMDLEAAKGRISEFDRFRDRFSEAIAEHEDLSEELKDYVVGVRDQAVSNINLKKSIQVFIDQGKPEMEKQIRGMIQEIDYSEVAEYCRGTLPEYRKHNSTLDAEISSLLQSRPQLPTPELEKEFKKVTANIEDYQDFLGKYIAQAEKWDPYQKVPLFRSLFAFLTGKRWITASFWQDFYGILPLFTGSVMISALALSLAVPFSVVAAIYVNQIAGPAELRIIKPYIEFIEALPSIVLGFFGIAVLGTALRNFSQIEWLSWFPGFPMAERLTIATAGILLALMAIPTIFTLVEDALNNVPRHYIEASFALGANRMQTIFNIMIPSALSGIVAAVLLGLGRVIGETMVVLLCAGGMIAIPDFTDGIGAFFQPAHTMTGIIAQELGEVELGSLHYRALFMVGLVLFFISLLLNYCSQFIIRKFRISE